MAELTISPDEIKGAIEQYVSTFEADASREPGDRAVAEVLPLQRRLAEHGQQQEGEQRRCEPHQRPPAGTPAGIGAGRTPPRFLGDGDVVRVVEAPAAAPPPPPVPPPDTAPPDGAPEDSDDPYAGLVVVDIDDASLRALRHLVDDVVVDDLQELVP